MKLLGARSILALLSVVSCLITLTCAVPDLKIERDFFEFDRDEKVQSYSAIMTFTTPGDTKDSPPQTMSNETFVNLVQVAYNQMAEEAGQEEAPSAMVAMTAGNKIYFASSLKFPRDINIGKVAPTMKTWLDNCERHEKQNNKNPKPWHRNRGKCGEINVVELYFSDPERSEPLDGERMAAWVYHRDDGTANNTPPCGKDDGADWGCKRLIRVFKLRAVSRKNPNSQGQDDFEFEMSNPRSC